MNSTIDKSQSQMEIKINIIKSIYEIMSSSLTSKIQKSLLTLAKAQSKQSDPIIPINQLQTNLLNLWTQYSVDQTYQNLFLIFIQSFKRPKDQAKQFEIQIRKTYEKSSLYFLLIENLQLREQIKTQISDQLEKQNKNQTMQKVYKVDPMLRELCDKLKNLRRINLLISQTILKMFEDFKVINEKNIGSIASEYIKLFIKLDSQNDFIKDSFLNEYILFQKGFDPFFLVHYEETMKSSNPLSLKKHKPVEQLFQMNISYVYRLMRTQQKMLKYMLMIDDQGDRERKQIINRQRLIKMAHEGTRKSMEIPREDSRHKVFPSLDRLTRKNQTGSVSVASTIRPFLPSLVRKPRMPMNKHNLDESDCKQCARKKIYSLRPLDSEDFHNSIGKDSDISNTPKNLSKLRTIDARKGYDESQKNLKSFQTQDEPIIIRRKQKYKQQQRYQPEVSEVQRKNKFVSSSSQKKWNLKKIKQQRSYLKPIKTQISSEEENLEDQNPNEFYYLSKKGSKQSENYPMYVSLKKSQLSQSEVEQLSRMPRSYVEKKRALNNQIQQQQLRKAKSNEKLKTIAQKPKPKKNNEKVKQKVGSINKRKVQQQQSQQQQEQEQESVIQQNAQSQQIDQSEINRLEQEVESEEQEVEESEGNDHQSLVHNGSMRIIFSGDESQDQDDKEEQSEKEVQRKKKKPIVDKSNKKIKIQEEDDAIEQNVSPKRKTGQKTKKITQDKKPQKKTKKQVQNQSQQEEIEEKKPLKKPVKQQKQLVSRKQQNQSQQDEIEEKKPLKKSVKQKQLVSKKQKNQEQEYQEQEQKPATKLKNQNSGKKNQIPLADTKDKNKKQHTSGPENDKQIKKKSLINDNKSEVKKNGQISMNQTPRAISQSPVYNSKNFPQVQAQTKHPQPSPKQGNANKTIQSQANTSSQKAIPASKAQQARIKMIPGKISYPELASYLKSKPFNFLYKEKIQAHLPFVLSSSQNTQTYLNEFIMNDKLAVVALASPTASGNIVIYLWAPIEEACDEKMSLFFLRKYLDYIEQQTTIKNIVYCGPYMSELKQQGFEYQKDNNYIRKRVKQVKREYFEFEYFFSMEMSNISFNQSTQESLLYSQEITPLTQSNSWCHSTVLSSMTIPQQLDGTLIIQQNIPTLNLANSILEKDSYDTFEVGEQKIKFSGINMSRAMITEVPRLEFIANQGYMVVMGKNFLQQANRKVSRLDLLNQIGLWFGKGFSKVQQMVKFINTTIKAKDSFMLQGKQEKFAFKMFSKQLYGKYCISDPQLDKAKAFYCNWDLNFAWRDQIAGKIIHNVEAVKQKFGPQSFTCVVQINGLIVMGFQLTQEDFLY